MWVLTVCYRWKRFVCVALWIWCCSLIAQKVGYFRPTYRFIHICRHIFQRFFTICNENNNNKKHSPFSATQAYGHVLILNISIQSQSVQVFWSNLKVRWYANLLKKRVVPIECQCILFFAEQNNIASFRLDVEPPLKRLM